MTLEGACRGSIILTGKYKLVVTCVIIETCAGVDRFWYRCVEVLPDDQLRIGEGITIGPDAEVELCFPGVAYDLPDFIK